MLIYNYEIDNARCKLNYRFIYWIRLNNKNYFINNLRSKPKKISHFFQIIVNDITIILYTYKVNDLIVCLNI